MAGDINVNEFLTTKNMAIAAGLLGFYLGTKTPGYVDRRLEAFAEKFAGIIGQSIAQGTAYKANGGSPSGDPIERLYQVVTVMAERQEETLGFLKQYMSQTGKQ